MKNLRKLLGIIAIGVVIGFALTGCADPTKDDGGGSGNTGTITVKNEEKQYSIRQVTITDQETNSRVIDERVAIGIDGGSKSFTVPPGRYIVTIQDDDADFYADYGYYFSLSSLQFTITAGATKTVIYNLDKNENNLIVQ